ncbi:hypothetical protein QDX21_11490 [Auritidibacter ignavus]|uniref:Uncharacterized protein n=1 Tax=Auritidibacter ignavus TaxID=678932 RepID=A0AAJ6AHM1_9MICC|nr:hypothetical protein [Auritidibacter ignavus]WGH92902.1 hypothetical protein QDX21_11490 [Auritidibacter ignavus]
MRILEATTFNTDQPEERRDQQAREIEIISSAINDVITRAGTSVMNMDEYDRKYRELECGLQEATTKLEAIEAEINDRRERLTQVRAVLNYLEPCHHCTTATTAGSCSLITPPVNTTAPAPSCSKSQFRANSASFRIPVSGHPVGSHDNVAIKH